MRTITRMEIRDLGPADWAEAAAIEAAGIWTLQVGIFPENEASLRPHHGCRFRLVGVRERLGEVNGVLRDVLLLERRTEAIE